MCFSLASQGWHGMCHALCCSCIEISSKMNCWPIQLPSCHRNKQLNWLPERSTNSLIHCLTTLTAWWTERCWLGSRWRRSRCWRCGWRRRPRPLGPTSWRSGLAFRACHSTRPCWTTWASSRSGPVTAPLCLMWRWGQFWLLCENTNA